MLPVALVTGGAKRIGAAISEFLHQKGMSIAIHCHTALVEAHELAEKFNAERENSGLVIQADLRDADAYEKIIALILEKWERLDVLINNASVFYPTPFEETASADFEALFATNLKAPFFLTRAALKSLQKNSGCVINITDIHAQKPLKFYSLYTMSKAGLKMMTESLAKELAPTVRVNAVSPGAILWPEKNLDSLQREKIIQKIPLKHAGKPDDVTKAIGFLIDSKYVTGQTVIVDGGRLLD